jgi:hypothetical protein
VLLERLLPATARDLLGSLAQLGDERLHPGATLVERVRGLYLRAEHGHGAEL